MESANESKFWLGLLRGSKKADEERVNKLLKETDEIANILGSSILTLKGKKKIKLYISHLFWVFHCCFTFFIFNFSALIKDVYPN